MEPVLDRQRECRLLVPLPSEKIRSTKARARLRASPAAGSGVAYGSLLLSPTRLIRIDSLRMKLARTPGANRVPCRINDRPTCYV